MDEFVEEVILPTASLLAMLVFVFALALAGCGAFGLPTIELPVRATASRCAADQDLRQVWGVWQCVDRH